MPALALISDQGCPARALLSKVAYQAVVDCAMRDGRPREPGAVYYRHDTLPDRALQWRILSAELCEDLTWLQGLRVKADYQEDYVDYDEACSAVVAAEKIVSELVEGDAP
jgi:hypothetical protein